MNDTKLRNLITEAVKLDRLVADLSEKLKGYKAAIAAEAELRQDEATPTEGGGTSLTLEGIDGCVCRVTTAGPTLKATVKAEGKDIEKVKAAAKGFFPRLFETVLAYKPIESFRATAEELLGKDAAKLIKACENAGKTTVSFETKETT